MIRLALALALMPLGAAAQERIAGPNGPFSAWAMEGSYDDARFMIEVALQARGLGIDQVSPVGETLATNLPTLGLGESVYDRAEVLGFCSMQIAAEVFPEAPMAIGFCPMRLFLYEIDGAVTMGFVNFPDMEQTEAAQALLTEVAEAAAAGEF